MPPKTIDAYLARVGPPQRAALEKLRQTMRALMPQAEECISYAIPAFRMHGQVVGGFAARGSYCSYFPFSGSTLHTLAAELEAYEQTKSALHFQMEKGLPKALVKKLLRARLAEIETRLKAKRAASAR